MRFWFYIYLLFYSECVQQAMLLLPSSLSLLITLKRSHTISFCSIFALVDKIFFRVWQFNLSYVYACLRVYSILSKDKNFLDPLCLTHPIIFWRIFSRAIRYKVQFDWLGQKLGNGSTWRLCVFAFGSFLASIAQPW